MTRDEEDALINLFEGFIRQDQALKDLLGFFFMHLAADMPQTAARLSTQLQGVISHQGIQPTEEFRALVGYVVPHLTADPDAQFRSLLKDPVPRDREGLRAALRVIRGGKSPDEDGPSTGE